MSDKQLIKQLLQDFETLKKENAELRSRVAELELRLAKYENPKNSGNSSVPPSQDPFGKTKSLREKSKKPQGGQKGHEGSKLKMVATADAIVVHDVENCSCCGNSLEEAPEHFDARQVFDIPEIKIYATEHRRLHRRCVSCGKSNKGQFPEQLVQEAQYGTHLKSLCVYLQNYQMLPFARCSELIPDLTGHCISTGSLSNFQKQCFGGLRDYEQHIRQQLLQSPILHADETGVRLNGKNSWIHVVSNKTISLFSHHLNRGKQAMDAVGLLELYKGTLVHDRFSSYFSYECDHGLCNAHILRDLVYVEEAFDAPWAKQIRKLLCRAKRDKEENPNLKAAYYSRIFKRYTGLVRPIIKEYNGALKKTDEQRLAFALEKHKYLFLKFLKQIDVPFDNNQAERDLRMIRAKQKVSGCFRSQNHAQYFARIRGYISTLKKNNKSVLDNIQNVFLQKPFLPIMAE